MIMDATDARPPVLIVGGGPVGLGLALELAYHGVKSKLIEEGDGIVRLSKMGGISVRSMEYCRRWGVAEEVRECGFPADYPHDQYFCTSLNDELVGVIEIPSQNAETANHHSPEKRQRCPQLWFDPILQNKAAQNRLINLSYNTRLLDITQHPDHVEALLKDVLTGQTRVIEADYLVGCDGGGSTVRDVLGYDLEGERLSNSVGIYFTLRNLHDFNRWGKGTRYWMVSDEGIWGNLTVVDGSDIWRLTLSGSNIPVDMDNFDADHWLRKCLGRDDLDYEITAVLPWWRNRMVANHYGRSRVWLAGDAVHLNAPNGGFGMNTGLGDAVNLAWKLAAVIQGWGCAELLPSYETERRPVAIRTVNEAADNFRRTQPTMSFVGVEDKGEDGNRKRADIFSVLASQFMAELKAPGIHLGYRYEGSPIVIADGTPEPSDDVSKYVPTSRPGHRAPHAWLSDGSSILDLFGHGFTLLIFGADNGVQSSFEIAAASRGVPLSVKAIHDPDAASLYERKYVLVRPDGHVCWRGDRLERPAGEIIDIITGKLPTSHPISRGALPGGD